MTIYGTPGSTPLNMNPFQGTQPGSPVGATLQVSNPGVGLFPPNSDSHSGDSMMASISRGNTPMNVTLVGFGNTSNQGNGPSGNGGRTPAESMCNGESNGTTAGFVNNGGSANANVAGGNSFGAGGMNQTVGPCSGESTQMPTAGPSLLIAFGISAVPVYKG